MRYISVLLVLAFCVFMMFSCGDNNTVDETTGSTVGMDNRTSESQNAAQETEAVFDIDTRIVTMKYPAKWREDVQIDVSDDGVRFSNNGTALFDLLFHECDGYLLGSYNGTPIYIIDYPVDDAEQANMQEDVNVILQYLMDDPSFQIEH